MKQHIDQSQLEELSEKGKQRLTAFLNKSPITGNIPKSDFQWGIYPSQLTIGKMIEFLSEHGIIEINQPIYLEEKSKDNLWSVEERYEKFDSSSGNIMNLYHEELADALWSACVEVLESEE